MSQLVRKKEGVANAGSISTDLELRGLSIVATAHFRRRITINKGAANEEVLQDEHPNREVSIHINPSSDESWLSLLNSTETVLGMAGQALAKGDELIIQDSAPQAPEEQAAPKTSKK